MNHSNVLAYEVDFIHLAGHMAGKKKNRRGLSLEVYKKEYEKIGNHLTKLRKDAGYSAGLDFALDHDLPPSQYARYEAGANMKLNSLILVVSKHNLTLEEFFKGFK